MATFCVLHGAWHEPSCWDALIARLRDRGHAAVAPDLPFHDPAAGFEQRVRPALEALDAATDAPVVVGHSLGSGYGPLVAVARPCSLLVHLCPRLGPFTPPAGAPPMFRPGIPFPPERPDGTSEWDPEVATEVLYSRLGADTAQALATRLRPLAPAAGEYPLRAHPDVPTIVIYASADEFFEPDWERFMARELMGVEPIEIAGGHFPMAEDPDSLAELLDRLAEDHAGKASP